MQHSTRGSQPQSQGYATLLVDLDMRVLSALIDWLCGDFNHQMNELQRRNNDDAAIKQARTLRSAAITLVFLFDRGQYRSLNNMILTQVKRDCTVCAGQISFSSEQHKKRNANRDVDMMGSDGRMWQLSRHDYDEFAKTVDWLVSEAAKRPQHTQ